MLSVITLIYEITFNTTFSPWKRFFFWNITASKTLLACHTTASSTRRVFFSAQPNKDNLFVENVTMVGKAIKYKRNLKVAVLPSYLTAYCLVCFPPDFPHTSHAERTAPFSSVSLSAIVQVWQINPVHIVSTWQHPYQRVEINTISLSVEAEFFALPPLTDV